MTRSKHLIAQEIEETREELASAAKMALVSLVVRNPVTMAAKTISGFIRRRRARSQDCKDRRVQKVSKSHTYRNLGIALGTGVVAGFAYQFWRRSRA
jgi:hypothetical protein